MKLELDDDGCLEIVYSDCYGGFGISREALKRMIELGNEEAKIWYDKNSEWVDGSRYNSFFQSVKRYDPILVEVVKELKNKASGESASLCICKVNLLNTFTINNYDGRESVRGANYEHLSFGRYNDNT